MDPTTALSIKNASGKTFSLLNDNNGSDRQQQQQKKDLFKVNKLTSSMNALVAPTRRKYHCTEPGCNKSFTTSGHLARHNRIHTGEKNFHCLHPGCPSRFSRQDNMMQHYRTHLSQKLRRQHLLHQQELKMMIKNEKEQPQLYRHSHHESEDRMLFQPLVQQTTPTVNRSRRSTTMPSLPYPPSSTLTNTKVIMNRPRRALSTSSSCSSSSSSSFSPSPPMHNSHYYEHQQHYYHHHHYDSSNVLPLPYHHSHYQQQQQQQQQRNVHYYQKEQHSVQQQKQHHYEQQQKEENDWTPNSQKSLSSLLHLANIVSTFG